MYKDLDYRSTRAVQICIVFASTLIVQQLLNFTHSGWIGFSVMMIYAGFDASTSLQRTYHRFFGMVLGLCFSFSVWNLVQLDYRFLYLIILFAMFCAFFTLGAVYRYPTLFSVSLTALGTMYFAPIDYHPLDFFFDYAKATSVAFTICIFFEYFIFKKSNLTLKFYDDAWQEIIQEFEQLLFLATHQPLHQSKYIKHSVHVTHKIMELKTFLELKKFDYATRKYNVEIEAFNLLVKQCYINIHQLFLLKANPSHPLMLATEALISQMKLIQYAENIQTQEENKMA